MTSAPSAVTPAASQPRIIGSADSFSPTPRRLQRSWWLREAAFTRTAVQPVGTSGAGLSPTSKTLRGSSELKPDAKTASMGATIGHAGRPRRPRGGLSAPAPTSLRGALTGQSWAQDPRAGTSPQAEFGPIVTQ